MTINVKRVFPSWLIGIMAYNINNQNEENQLIQRSGGNWPDESSATGSVYEHCAKSNKYFTWKISWGDWTSSYFSRRGFLRSDGIDTPKSKNNSRKKK